MTDACWRHQRFIRGPCTRPLTGEQLAVAAKREADAKTPSRAIILARTGNLIPSLIHPRAPTSIGVYYVPMSRQVDTDGQSCTAIRNPESGWLGTRNAQCE